MRTHQFNNLTSYNVFYEVYCVGNGLLHLSEYEHLL